MFGVFFFFSPYHCGIRVIFEYRNYFLDLVFTFDYASAKLYENNLFMSDNTPHGIPRKIKRKMEFRRKWDFETRNGKKKA